MTLWCDLSLCSAPKQVPETCLHALYFLSKSLKSHMFQLIRSLHSLSNTCTQYYFIICTKILTILLQIINFLFHFLVGLNLAGINDLLLETSKVYSGFLNDGVLLLNVSSHNFRQGWLLCCQEQAKECVSTIHVLFSSSHTQFLLYVSLLAQLCIYISKCPCPCYWPCGFCGRTYKISCKSQICV